MRIALGKIRRLREAAGLRQADMAEALGYRTVSGYSRLEAGLSNCTADRLIAIAEKLGVPVTDLVVAAESSPTQVAG